jgi:hypothetical protein
MAKQEYIKEVDGAVEVTLTDGRTLRMREPTVRDMKNARKAKGGEEEIATAMICNLCELAPDELDAITLRNFNRLNEAFELFTL